MNSRSIILNRVKKNKPSIESKIELSQFLVDESDNLIETFKGNLEANDGSCRIINSEEELNELLLKEIDGKSYLNLMETTELEQHFQSNWLDCPQELANLKLLIVRGTLGVAENGAVWIGEEMLQNIRILLFIVERTVFVLSKEKIVPTMHHAYHELGSVKIGFGAFVAGPSKTGDIEQNLVVGAHGPLSHLVLID